MNTKALRQKVLDLAIHGKLVPQNPNDESAEVLLKKIREEKAEKIKKGELKADKKDSFIFVGSDKRHYEQFADGTIKDIEDEIPFEVPKGWTWCRIKEVCTVFGRIGFRGYTRDDLVEKGNGAITLSPSNLINMKLDLTDCTYISWPKYEESPEIQLDINDIVVVKTGSSYGKTSLVDNLTEKTTLNPQLMVLKERKCNSKYLCYFLNTQYMRKHFEDLVNGTAIPTFSQEKFGMKLFPLPPVSEQGKIVSRIELIFDKIDLLENDKEDLDTIIKQTKSKILDLAIHGKLVPQNPNDEPAEELLKRISTSDNRPYEKVVFSEIDWTLPNNWCLCHFGDIATVINGKNQSKVKNPNGKYPIYGSGGIMGRADDYICPENCTIIGRKGSINNPIFVEEKFWNVDTAFGLCPSEAILPKFLFYFCEYFDFTTLDSSTTLPSLTKTNIQQIIFALPPIEEQKRILDKTEELFGKLDEIVLNLI